MLGLDLWVGTHKSGKLNGQQIILKEERNKIMVQFTEQKKERDKDE